MAPFARRIPILTLCGTLLGVIAVTASLASPTEPPAKDENDGKPAAEDDGSKPKNGAKANVHEGETKSPAPRGARAVDPDWRPPRQASDFAPGATRLAEDGKTPLPQRSPSGSTVRIRRGGDALLTRDAAALDDRSTHLDGTETETPPASAVSGSGHTIGPGASEQTRIFENSPGTAGQLPDERSGWEPESAYPPGIPGRAYRWNPAVWAKPISDWVWRPTGAWPPREEGASYPWNPTIWRSTSIDTTWVPSDAWGRSLAIAGPSRADETPAPEVPALNATNATKDEE